MARRMFSEKQIERIASVDGKDIAPSKITVQDIEKIEDEEGNALIKVVDALPETPVIGVIYLVKEA